MADASTLPPRAALAYRDPAGREARIELGAEPVTIGRAADCRIRSDDAMVSRRCARVLVEAGRYVVEDAGSSGGFFVNGQRARRQPLTDGDVIRCGSLSVRFVLLADAGADAVEAEGEPGKPAIQKLAEEVAGKMIRYLQSNTTEEDERLEQERDARIAEVIGKLRAEGKLPPRRDGKGPGSK